MGKDYLAAFVAKQSDATHGKIADGGSNAQKLKEAQKRLREAEAKLQKKTETEATRLFGPKFLDMTIDEYIMSFPKAQREAVAMKVSNFFMKLGDERDRVLGPLEREVERLGGTLHSGLEGVQLGALTTKVKDLLHHGVKGMKWGVRRSPKQLEAAAVSRGDADDSSSTKTSSEPETSSARYNRLKAQAKEKGANSLSEEDLKFFNARTDAVAKINKMHQQDPGWLSETTKKVIQKTTQEALQNISSAVAQKYVTQPVIKSLGAEPTAKPKKKKS